MARSGDEIDLRRGDRGDDQRIFQNRSLGLRHVTYAVTLEWNERERPKNGTLSLEKSAASLEKVRESAVILEKVLFTLL